MKSWWPTQQAKQANPEVAKYMNETPKVVAAHEAFKPDWNNTIVVSGDVAGEVRKLKERSGKRIVILGSNTLCVSLMQHGLVDEFQIMMNPIALGNGTPLFRFAPESRLEAVENARLQVRKRVAHLHLGRCAGARAVAWRKYSRVNLMA